jgi:hypothetical protein
MAAAEHRLPLDICCCWSKRKIDVATETYESAVKKAGTLADAFCWFRRTGEGGGCHQMKSGKKITWATVAEATEPHQNSDWVGKDE